MLVEYNPSRQNQTGEGGTLMHDGAVGILEEAEDEEESPAKIKLLEES